MLQNAPMYAYIPARDVARARKFYEETLGLKPKRETAGGVAYEFAKGTGCFLYPTPNAGTSRASQAFWQVEDVEREVRELKARGVKLLFQPGSVVFVERRVRAAMEQQPDRGTDLGPQRLEQRVEKEPRADKCDDGGQLE